MIVQAIPRGQSDKFRSTIERQILELESRIVPGLAKATERTLREQVAALESKLKPHDDKRNPAYYRPKRKPVHTAPVYHWSLSDFVAAKWGARQRSAGVCEICRAGPHEIVRMHTAPPNEDITRDHVECVCAVCADQFPRQEFF